MQQNESSVYPLVIEATRDDVVIERYESIAGNMGKVVLQSLALAVAENPALQQCSLSSLLQCGLRAAEDLLPVGELAYVVPFYNSRARQYEAKYIRGYKGLVRLALRSGNVRRIHVDKIYEGEVVEFDRFSGNPSLSGSKTSDEVIGWVGTIQTTSFAKTIYMSNQEIIERVKNSAGYKQRNGPWQTHREKMLRKTVLRELLGTYMPDATGFRDDDTDLIDVVANDDTVLDVEEELGGHIDGAYIKDTDADSDMVAAAEELLRASRNRQKTPLPHPSETIKELGF